jgi:hypothetical protein
MSATNQRHEHPAGSTTPGRSSRARVEIRLTTTSSFGRCAVQSRLVTSGGRGDASGRALLGPGGCCDRQPLRQRPPPAAFSATGRGCETTSDALCRARHPEARRTPDRYAPRGRNPGERHPRAKARRRGTRTPDSPSPTPRQRRRLERTRAPSIDECPLRPAFAEPRREPATGRAALPPRTGFRRSFTPRERGVRPARPGGQRGPAPLVDFCNRMNRPRARPRDRLHLVRARRACIYARPVSPALRSLPWACRTAVGARLRLGPKPQPPTSAPDMPPLRALRAARPSRGAPAEGSRARGRGLKSPRRLSTRLLAARASPQPDRLGHLLSRARGDSGWRDRGPGAHWP